MKNSLCSGNYKEFYGSIDKIGLATEELISVIASSMPLIAEDMSLGKLVVHFFSPPSPLEPKGEDKCVILYENDCNNDAERIFKEFITTGGGKVSFEAYPAKGAEWGEEEKDELIFLLKNIFAMCGRARLSDIVKKSMSTDVSTGLINANGFIAAGHRLAAEGRLHEYSAMYLNLRNFKFVNSQVGNKYGDTVIREYTNVLAAAVGVDGIVSRLGGDNFAILVKKERCEEIVQLIGGIDVYVTFSGASSHFCIQARAGVYDIKEGDLMPHVMNCISAAVSAARCHPTDYAVIFTPEVLYKMIKEQEIAANFPSALRRKEFAVYYQPKVSLETNEICGCEALVRWIRDGKIIPPMEFIPLFERNGSICSLDFYMLDKVCEHIKEWQEKGLEPVTVSVNFSKTHLHNPNIANDILNIIKKNEIDAGFIEIEMTEMSDFNDYDAFKKLVTKLKENGVMTSIDDFGTGYSSLNLLTDFMFDIVKLDKSFLDNIVRDNSRTDEIVVRNMVRMIRELDMKAIAEGVETAEQAVFLKDINCTMVQGYLFDKPLPEKEFETRLKSRKYDNIL